MGSEFSLANCMDNCRSKLKVWNKHIFGHVGKNIARLQIHLEWLELQSSMPDIIASMREKRVKLNCWRDKEDAMWHQRSRQNWIQSGDKNTSFFHSKVSSRFQNNYIEGIFNSNDVWVDGERGMENVVLHYYSNLFKSTNPTTFTKLLSVVQPKVSSTMNQFLTKEFQAREVVKL